jgi:pyruvate dehydrogenase E2 component (dihydrolipoamide acetyltransferase)
MALDELMAQLRDLVRRTRAGGLRSSELTDPTITVTSLGDRGARTVFGVIYPPQVALVGFGAITERAWAERGMVGVRSVADATLAADHRASDGTQGSALLAAIDHHLQEPDSL